MTQLDEVKLRNAGMTVRRMVQSYKMAVDPKEHITILSDQTLIEPEHIVEILRENGCSVGKWHKRWTPNDRRSGARQMKKIQEAASETQEQPPSVSQEPEENKEVKDMAETRPYHRRSKQEIEAAKAAEQKMDPAEVQEQDEVELKIPAPSWLYDLAETEYQLTKTKVEPYIKDFERMKEVEQWLSTHEAI